jgi:malonyl-CoA/methylmalonyl-CoA synthetase
MVRRVPRRPSRPEVGRGTRRYAAPVTRPPWSAHLPGGRALGADELVGDGTLLHRWAGIWADDPGARVLGWRGASPDGAARADGWLTAADLEARSAAAGVRFWTLGVRAGDCVVWSAVPDGPSIVAALGVLRLGGVLVPVPPGAPAAEVGHVVDDVRPALVVGDPGSAALRAETRTAVVDPAFDAAPAPTGRVPLDAADPADPALVVYTSGTTGTPKGAVLTHRNLLAGARSLALAWDLSPGDRLTLALPLFHVHGLCAGLFGLLAAEGSVVVHERFDAATVSAAPRRDGATVFFGVPTMYHRLAAEAGAGDLAAYRLCVSGSAPLPVALFDRVRERCGVTVLERYGMTETLLTLSNPLRGARVAGTVGFPLPGVEARLVGGNGDGDELEVRGPGVFAGYWERSRAAPAGRPATRWFPTGDLASADADGRFTLLGRSGDLIICGGHNVYPAEVEAVLAQYPGISEVAVVGVPSEEWGEEVVAWVVPSTGSFSPSDLLAFAAAHLARPKRPSAVRVLDALPRNAMGKVRRNALG